MIGFNRHQDALAGIQDELRQEMACSLGRVARTLEATLEELMPVDAQLRASPQSHPRLAERHEELRKKAETWLWYLIVQREAIGLTHHADVEELYPIPRRIAF